MEKGISILYTTHSCPTPIRQSYDIQDVWNAYVTDSRMSLLTEYSKMSFRSVALVVVV